MLADIRRRPLADDAQLKCKAETAAARAEKRWFIYDHPGGPGRAGQDSSRHGPYSSRRRRRQFSRPRAKQPPRAAARQASGAQRRRSRHWGPTRRTVAPLKLEHRRRQITTRAPLLQPFSNLVSLSTVRRCPETFVVISLTVQVLLR